MLLHGESRAELSLLPTDLFLSAAHLALQLDGQTTSPRRLGQPITSHTAS